MAAIQERDLTIPTLVACEALGVSRATLYRCQSLVGRKHGPQRRRHSPRRLSPAERARLLDTLHAEEFADQPPAEVYATLLGRGEYVGSIRTMYRILAEEDELRERRNQRKPHVHAKPSLTARAPNEVWTWDITKLATECKGVFLMAYVIIDLFSRYVVGWMLAEKECRHLAAQLFAETTARHGVGPGLTVHADRGAAMKSDTLAQLLASLGASRSFSRPRVSDDNPFSEAQFKTLKYQPEYPGRFASLDHGRTFLQGFFGWHNDEHHHAGLALFTPADVFLRRVPAVAARRQVALDEAFRAHPERFPNGPPKVRLPDAEVHINPLTSDAAALPSPAAPAGPEPSAQRRGEPSPTVIPEAPRPHAEPAHLDASTRRARSAPAGQPPVSARPARRSSVARLPTDNA